MSLDPSKIKPITLQKTLLLINNFVVNSSTFLNNFSESCEKKVSNISSKVTELEILLAVLEAKLNSIPLDGLAGNNNNNNNNNSSSSSSGGGGGESQPPPPPPSLPAPGAGPNSAEAAPPAPVDAPVPSGPPEGMVAAKDHPDYAPFFKMLKVGVPLPVVANKMTAGSLDASLLDSPDKLIPAP